MIIRYKIEVIKLLLCEFHDDLFHVVAYGNGDQR